MDAEPQTRARTDKIRSLSPDSRRSALGDRVTASVRAYARKHRIPRLHIMPAVHILAALDLELLPLLYAPEDLERRIADTFGALQSSPAADASAAPASDATPLDDGVAAAAKHDEMVALLREGIEIIDPTNLEALMPILLSQLGEQDLERAATDPVYRAIKYHDAITVLGPRSSPSNAVEAEMDGPPVKPQQQGESSEPASLSSSVSSSSNPGPTVDLIPPHEIRLETLAQRSAVHIMAHLTGPSGDAVLDKLGMVRPTRLRAKEVGLFIIDLREMIPVKRAGTVAAKIVNVTGVSEQG